MTHNCAKCGKLMTEQRHLCKDCRVTDEMLKECRDATKRAKQSRKDIPPCDAAHCYYFSRCAVPVSTTAPDNLIWMTPEEEEKRIRADMLKEVLRIAYAETMQDGIHTGWLLYDSFRQELESLRQPKQKKEVTE